MQCPSQNIKLFLVICVVIPLSTTTPTPFITSCSSSPECLKRSLQAVIPSFIAGSPSLGITSLDPFLIDKLELVLPGDLKIEFRQGFSKGLKKCKVDSASFVEDVLKAQFRCNFFIKGKYKSSGKLLMFSVDGDGDSAIICRDIKIRTAIKLGTTIDENGEEHLNITQFKFDHSYEGHVTYKLTNLIKSSPQLSNIILQFMNNNWRMVAEEFGTPIVDFGINSVLANINKLFKIVPLRHLLDNNSQNFMIKK